MTVLLIVIHVIVCIGLIGLVLIQRGRGSGLVESFHGVESMFGPKTNAFLTKSTTILSILFFLTCLSLALLSVKQSKSLMRPADTSRTPVTKTTSQATEAADKETTAKAVQAPLTATQTQQDTAQAPQAAAQGATKAE